jgi:L-alanine-DL-glutamate epimerase-like enolase superfamily enzyme
VGKSTDIRTIGAALYFLPVQTRVPLKFGAETLTHVTCARARVTVADESGRAAEGWGETPLSVQWVWPSAAPYEERHEALKQFCIELTDLWANVRSPGHPIELGHDFQETVLPGWLKGFNQRQRRGKEPMPWLAALVCCSAFDLAMHDAYGQLHGRPTYDTYNAEFMNRDLAHYLRPAASQAGLEAASMLNRHAISNRPDDRAPAEVGRLSFEGKFPADFLLPERAVQMPAWHLVGGLDLLDDTERRGDEPDDGYPVTLPEWIQRDGLKCLKVKLRGNDAGWDYQRLLRVGEISLANGADWLTADFNCTVSDPEYVNAILDRLRDEHARIYGMILYVEQPFPYELEQHRIDVHSVSARKPLFLDESAHNWQMVRLGRELGWSGVALKTCKTQTGALLSACWAKAHGMGLMVQDLTNPMLAQIPHALLAAHVGTIMGVETNAMQFYPGASRAEERVHPGLYRRRAGAIDLSSVNGPGFGYRIAEIGRELPPPVAQFGEQGKATADERG